MAKELEQYGLENLRLVDSRSYEVNCNVKVLLDAFLEVYHLKSIHQQTVDRFLDHRGMFVALWPNGHSRLLTPNRRPDWKDPGTIGMPKIPTITRSDEHTSELQSLMRISYAVFCLTIKTN